MGSDYWEGFYQWMQEKMCKEKRYISNKELDILFMEDDPDRVIGIIKSFYPEGYKLNF